MPDQGKEHWPQFQHQLEQQGKRLPAHVTQEFEEYLKCGLLEFGFLRVQCEACHVEKLAWAAPWFSCRKRGFCPSCGARRMADSAAHLVDRNAGPGRIAFACSLKLKSISAFKPAEFTHLLTRRRPNPTEKALT